MMNSTVSSRHTAQNLADMQSVFNQKTGELLAWAQSIQVTMKYRLQKKDRDASQASSKNEQQSCSGNIHFNIPINSMTINITRPKTKVIKDVELIKDIIFDIHCLPSGYLVSMVDVADVVKERIQSELDFFLENDTASQGAVDRSIRLLDITFLLRKSLSSSQESINGSDTYELLNSHSACSSASLSKYNIKISQKRSFREMFTSFFGGVTPKSDLNVRRRWSEAAFNSSDERIVRSDDDTWSSPSAKTKDKVNTWHQRDEANYKNVQMYSKSCDLNTYDHKSSQSGKKVSDDGAHDKDTVTVIGLDDKSVATTLDFIHNNICAEEKPSSLREVWSKPAEESAAGLTSGTSNLQHNSATSLDSHSSTSTATLVKSSTSISSDLSLDIKDLVDETIKNAVKELAEESAAGLTFGVNRKMNDVISRGTCTSDLDIKQTVTKDKSSTFITISRTTSNSSASGAARRYRTCSSRSQTDSFPFEPDWSSDAYAGFYACGIKPVSREELLNQFKKAEDRAQAAQEARVVRIYQQTEAKKKWLLYYDSESSKRLEDQFKNHNKKYALPSKISDEFEDLQISRPGLKNILSEPSICISPGQQNKLEEMEKSVSQESSIHSDQTKSLESVCTVIRNAGEGLFNDDGTKSLKHLGSDTEQSSVKPDDEIMLMDPTASANHVAQLDHHTVPRIPDTTVSFEGTVVLPPSSVGKVRRAKSSPNRHLTSTCHDAENSPVDTEDEADTEVATPRISLMKRFRKSCGSRFQSVRKSVSSCFCVGRRRH